MKRVCIAVFLLFLACGSMSAQVFANPLNIPDTLSGTVFNLVVNDSTKQFLPGAITPTYGINSDYLGPTVILNKGDFVTLNVTNNLPDTTTMHWHGMHVAPMDDGGPHTPIPPGTTWSPDFTVLDEATIFWYHPHLHHYTAEQVNFGAAGMIIVRDSNEASLNLPRTYGVDDIPLIIQDRSFDSTTNELIFAAMADTMMVNGTLAPYLEVPAQMVRFRILNASLQRVYNLGFPPLNMYQVGSDGGLLESPMPINRMQLAPGERADIIIDFSGQTGLSAPLFALNSEMDPGISGGPGGPGGGPGNPLDEVDFSILEFRVTAPTANPITTLPTTMNTFSVFNEADAARTRTKVFDTLTTGFPYYINSTLFDMDVANDTVLLDDIEIWELVNKTDVAHPFHIHDIQFYVLDVNGNPPRPEMIGRKDVVLVQPGDSIRFITKFDDFADPTTPYMYHCHNLFHEDAGMMGQFIVVDSLWLKQDEADEPISVRIWPNPAQDRVQVELEGLDGEWEMELWSLDGRRLHSHSGFAQGLLHETLDLSALPGGMYLLRIRTNAGMVSRRIIRNR